MTQPVSHGYPDWNRQYSAADIEIIYLTSESIAVATTYPATGGFFVGILPYLRISQSAGAQRSRVLINWFADAALTRGLGADTLTTRENGAVTQCVPVRGPFATFRVDLSAYPGTHALQVFAVPVPMAQAALTSENIQLITIDGVSVAAGATNTTSAFPTRGGWAYWQGVFDDGVNGLIKLVSVDWQSATRLLDVMGPGISNQGRLIFLPALPVRVVSLNSDGVARDLYVTVLHRPFGL